MIAFNRTLQSKMSPQTTFYQLTQLVCQNDKYLGVLF